MSAKQIEVQIMGQSYILGCPEGGEQRLKAAVHNVDAAMCKIRDAGKIKARERIAVLAALNIAFDQSSPAPSTSNGVAAPEPLHDEATAQRLTDLMRRLDLALAEDGQLL